MMNSSQYTLDYVFWFEHFDTDGYQRWTTTLDHISLWLSVIYVMLIFVGRRWMQNKESFDLRLLLTLWNFILCSFSVIGAIRTTPELIYGIQEHGLKYTLCNQSFYYGTTGFWAFTFSYSKALELGDTAFIVLRKQKLVFLHWYHHISVMIYCFYSYPQHISYGRWFMVMNYLVHSLMYGYYCLKSLQVSIPKRISMTITLLQIFQMLTGLVVIVITYFLKTLDSQCHVTYNNIVAAFAMYISYFVLFLLFFYNSYSGVRKPVKEHKQT